MSQHTDLKNTYLNEQGLKQERDALRVENERLRHERNYAQRECEACAETAKKALAENERLRADLKSAVALIGREWPDVAEEKEIYRLLKK